MKIEIELADYDSLRYKLEASIQECNKLKQELKENEENEWEKKAIQLSKRLFGKYISVVFEKLGFDKQSGSSESWFYEGAVYFDQYLGNKWYDNKDKLEIEITTSISKQFRNAFLKIGVIPDKAEVNRYVKTMLSENE